MTYELEDLPQHGVILIPPTSPEYDVLLEDIRRRHENPLKGSLSVTPEMGADIRPGDREVSAILINRSPHAIILIQLIWTLVDATGRVESAYRGPGMNSSVLLPFGMSERQENLERYWHTVFPGSKRYLSLHNDRIGDNTDVRMPNPDELWTGGTFSIGGGRGGSWPKPLEKLTITLDGVFFEDGGYAGPDRAHLWEQIVSAAKLPIRVAKVARNGKEEGIDPQQIFRRIEAITGPVRDPLSPRLPPNYTREEQYRVEIKDRVARMVQHARTYCSSDEEALAKIIAWADAPLPHFHKL